MYITSIFDIDTQLLNKKGIYNLIIDIDNTLSKWNSKEPDERVCNLIKNLKLAGFNICILSNSSNKRVSKYCSNLDIIYVDNAFKPFKTSFIRATKLLNSNRYNTCVIGDQIFTDIWGGNSCGLLTILVTPLERNEFITTKIVRKIERIVLKKFFKAVEKINEE
jgi:HAD superfamily phosphatase (TIGR01668 family)